MGAWSPFTLVQNMHMRLTGIIALFLGLVGDAAATSCSHLNNRFFFACDAEHCVGLFSVRDVPSTKYCERRGQVEAFDPRVTARAMQAVEAGRPVGSTGILELKMTMPYWRNDAANPRDWFEQNLGSAVTLVSTDASPVAIGALRASVESAERSAYWNAILFLIETWGSAAIVILALIHSVHVYFKALYSASAPWTWRPILLPVAVQLALLGGALSVFWQSVIGEFWFGLVLVPAVPLILACEGWALFLKIRGERRARGRGAGPEGDPAVKK